jgi:CAAX prenyl protease-like protein
MGNDRQKTDLKLYIPYVLPFAVFLILTSIGSQFENGPYIVYPIKTLVVAALLFFYRKKYYDDIKFNFSLLAVLTGLIVFFAWVLPEGFYPKLGHSSFNPYKFNNLNLAYFLIFFRLFGASVVVPIFEELFWRSFLVRYIINPDFKKVSIGEFTWPSFIITVLLFGSEHNEWLVGIVAGIIYNGLLYYKKDLFSCIIAHGVTNFVLGVYVIRTHSWYFW